MALTERQRQALLSIESHIRQTGWAPSVRELCRAMGLSSSSTVHVHLRALRDLGYIEYGGGARKIRILKSAPQEGYHCPSSVTDP